LTNLRVIVKAALPLISFLLVAGSGNTEEFIRRTQFPVASEEMISDFTRVSQSEATELEEDGWREREMGGIKLCQAAVPESIVGD
jgi:hypothetical protein